MAAESSFDVVSKVEIQEVKNAIDQATKEVNARFDLKNSKSKIELEKEEAIQLASSDEMALAAVIEILSQKLVKRGISLKNLEYEKIEQGGGTVGAAEDQAEARDCKRQCEEDCRSHQGFEAEGTGQHQGETVRVVSKDKDTLQQIMAKLRGGDFGVELQFTNFRSN